MLTWIAVPGLLVLLYCRVHCVVIMNSTIPDNDPIVHRGDMVEFTCTVRGSNTLAWSSVQYIGPTDRLEFSVVSSNGSKKTPNEYTVAELVDADSVNMMLISTLRIQAQAQFYMSTVTCSSIGTDESRSIDFEFSDNPSVIPVVQQVCINETTVLTFSCETRDSEVLAWENSYFIGNGSQIQLASFEGIGTTKRSEIHSTVEAVLTSNEMRNGVQVLISNLTLTFPAFLASSLNQYVIVCINTGLDSRNTTVIQVKGDCESTTTYATGNSPSGKDPTDTHDALAPNHKGSVATFVVPAICVGFVVVLAIVITVVFKGVCRRRNGADLNPETVDPERIPGALNFPAVDIQTTSSLITTVWKNYMSLITLWSSRSSIPSEVTERQCTDHNAMT